MLSTVQLTIKSTHMLCSCVYVCVYVCSTEFIMNTCVLLCADGGFDGSGVNQRGISVFLFLSQESIVEVCDLGWN